MIVPNTCWEKEGHGYLIVAYILCSSMFILNDRVVKNDTCTYDCTEYLLRKRRTWTSDDMKNQAWGAQMLSLSLYVLFSMQQTSIALESIGVEWSSQTPATRGRGHHRDHTIGCTHVHSLWIHISCFSLEYTSEQRWLVKNIDIVVRLYYPKKSCQIHKSYKGNCLEHDTSRKKLKTCGAIYFYRRIRLWTTYTIFSGGSLRKPSLEIVFL
jgi:hypothetical protein